MRKPRRPTMNNSTSPMPRNHQVLALIGWLALCISAGSTAAFVSTGGWYENLYKPSWNPPSWVFGPVWSLLYVMMAVAAWLVWREGGWRRQKQCLTLFLVQWILNTLWTPIFFGMHRLDWAFAEILLLWLALVATIRCFWPVQKASGLLLLPYLAWISFAAVLNFTIWRMNWERLI